MSKHGSEVELGCFALYSISAQNLKNTVALKWVQEWLNCTRKFGYENTFAGETRNAHPLPYMWMYMI